MRNLGEFAKDLLDRRGALVDEGNDETLDVVLPEELSHVFSGEDRRACSWIRINIASLGLGSDHFRRMEELLGARTCEIALPDEVFRPEKIRAGLRDRIIFNNAVFDDEVGELRKVSWLLIWSRYAAVSDDRREGMVSFWINETNLSTGLLSADVEDRLRAMSVWMGGLGSSDQPPPKTSDRPFAEVLSAASHSAAAFAREALGDYLEAAKRRLERDVRRVCEYYGSLKAEVDRRALRRPEEKEKLARKANAIELERKAKIDDLRSHYALAIDVHPAAIIRVSAMAPVFPLVLKRRKESRRFSVVYNPLIHRLENPPCEACRYGIGPYWMCDERLHILCDRCFAACAVCGRRFCRVCHAVCPKGCQ